MMNTLAICLARGCIAVTPPCCICELPELSHDFMPPLSPTRSTNPFIQLYGDIF